MTFTITLDRAELADVVGWAARAIPLKPNPVVLAGVKLDLAADGTLTVAGYDHETSAVATMTVPNLTATGKPSKKALEPFTVILPGKMLESTLARLEGATVTLSHSDDEPTRVTLACGRSRAKFPTMNVLDYPTLPESVPMMGALPADALADAVSTVAPFAKKDMTQPHLTAVAITASDGRIEFVASDGVQMSRVAFTDWDGPDSVVLAPAAVLLDAVKAIAGENEVSIGWNGDASFGSFTLSCTVADGPGGESGTRTLTTRIIPGQAPPYGRFFDATTHPIVIHVETDALLRAIRLGAAFVPEKAPLRLSIGLADGNLDSDHELTVSAGGVADASIIDIVPVHMSGDFPDVPYAFGFNPAYALNAIGAMGDAKWVRMATGDSATRNAVRFCPADGPEDEGVSNVRSVVTMPVKIQSVGGE